MACWARRSFHVTARQRSPPSSWTGCFRSASPTTVKWYSAVSTCWHLLIWHFIDGGFKSNSSQPRVLDRIEQLILLSGFHVNVKGKFPLLSQDYKTYLDFVLALENRKEPAALQYIFKLLDIEDQGHLNVFSLNYFFRVPVFWLK